MCEVVKTTMSLLRAMECGLLVMLQFLGNVAGQPQNQFQGFSLDESLWNTAQKHPSEI